MFEKFLLDLDLVKLHKIVGIPQVLALQFGHGFGLVVDRHHLSDHDPFGPYRKGAKMNVRYIVDLSADDQEQLESFVRSGSRLVRNVKRAQILLAANQGASDAKIAGTVTVGTSTVYRTKRRFVEGGVELAINDDPRPGAGRKLTGKEEALLVATACASPPEGRAKWTCELLAGEIVRLTDHATLSRETVRRRLAGNKPSTLMSLGDT